MCVSTGREPWGVNDELNVGDVFKSKEFNPNDPNDKADAIMDILLQLKYTRALCEGDDACKSSERYRPTDFWSSEDDGLDLTLEKGTKGRKYYKGIIIRHTFFSLYTKRCDCM